MAMVRFLPNRGQPQVMADIAAFVTPAFGRRETRPYPGPC